MRVRPWHVIVCVVALSAVLVAAAYIVGEPAKELLLGLGLNLLSSIVFFILLDLYWGSSSGPTARRCTGSTTRGSPGTSSGRSRSASWRRSSTPSPTTPPTATRSSSSSRR